MKAFYPFLAILIFMVGGIFSYGGEVRPMREVRTYMSFTWPLDPAKIVTLPDMDLSYALAGTLVEWDRSKQIVSGIASRWEIIGKDTYRFTVRKNLKWSNGVPLLSSEIKKSLERGMRIHPEDLRALAQLVDTISCPSENIIDFKLRVNAVDSNLLGKLTEPNYGVVRVDSSGDLDLSITTGAFFVTKGAKDLLELKANKNWHNFSDGLADRILIRQVPAGLDLQQVLLQKDAWPNVVQLSSLMSAQTLEKYQREKFSFWNRPTDRIFIFELSRRLHSRDGLELFKFFGIHISNSKLVDGFVGYGLTDQIFPRGYQLHDKSFKPAPSDGAVIPAQFKKRPLEILISPERVPKQLQKNIETAIISAVGLKPKFISISMKDFPKQYRAAQYDFYVGTVGIADPDAEGLMSFYFENEVKVIPSISEDFLKRLDAARKQTDKERRLSLMRAMLSDATHNGNILPWFHLSTMGLASPEIDLEQVPTTDESVTLSKIRFRSEGSK